MAVGLLMWVAEKILEAAQQGRDSPAAVYARLRDLECQKENGMISESEFDQREDELLDRLETLRHAAALGRNGARR